MPLPGLTPTQPGCEADVQTFLQSKPEPIPAGEPIPSEPSRLWYVSPYLNDQGEPTLKAWRSARFWTLRYSDNAEFVLDCSGDRIWATWPDTLTLEDASVYLLGPVLGFALRLRGLVCLHASAISIKGGAVAFVGPAGIGKSTIAASFALSGYPVLSDDVVALVDRDGGFLLQPAYPHLRLWSESVKMLYGSPDALPRLVSGDSPWDKRYLNLIEGGHNFQQEPLALAAIYLLSERSGDSSAPVVERVTASAGLMALIANAYSSLLIDSDMRSQEFDTLSRVARTIPLARATPHANPARLDQFRDLILDDFNDARP